MTLLEVVNYPQTQEDVVSNWQSAQSLVEDADTGVKIAAAPCLLALAVPCLPFCLQERRVLSGSWLAGLHYSLGHTISFCGCTRGHHVALESFSGKVLFFFFFFVSGDPTV